MYDEKTYREQRADYATAKQALDIARHVASLAYLPRWQPYEWEDVDVPGGRYIARIRVRHDDMAGLPWDQCTPLAAVRALGRRAPEHPEPGWSRIGDRDQYEYNTAGAIAEVLSWDKAHRMGKAAGLDYARTLAKHERDTFDSWLRGQWEWIGIEVEICAATDDPEALATDSIWGVEGYGDGWRTIADEVIGTAVHEAERARLDNLAACHPLQFPAEATLG